MLWGLQDCFTQENAAFGSSRNRALLTGQKIKMTQRDYLQVSSGVIVKDLGLATQHGLDTKGWESGLDLA